MNIVVILGNIFIKNLNKYKQIAINIIINIVEKQYILYILVNLEVEDNFILQAIIFQLDLQREASNTFRKIVDRYQIYLFS